jgi:hypothetical protein
MIEEVTFVPKPELDFTAVEFTGGSDQGQEVVDWVQERGGKAVWFAEDPGSHIRCGLREHIKIILGDAYMFVYVGDFVMRESEGIFKPLTQRLIAAKYDRAFVPAVISILPIVTETTPELAAA